MFRRSTVWLLLLPTVVQAQGSGDVIYSPRRAGHVSSAELLYTPPGEHPKYETFRRFARAAGCDSAAVAHWIAVAERQDWSFSGKHRPGDPACELLRIRGLPDDGHRVADTSGVGTDSLLKAEPALRARGGLWIWHYYGRRFVYSFRWSGRSWVLDTKDEMGEH